MKLLAGKNYDFLTTRVQKATSSLLPMTAFDTTNLRLTFTAPSTGVVQVRLRSAMVGATTGAQILLGVLDGATVKGRQTPITYHMPSSSSAVTAVTASFLVGGLTPGTSYTWDAAYGVEFVVASTNIVYGGLDDTTGGNQFGGFCFEVWDTPGLLAWANYDPGTADASKLLSSNLAMTALDTTNLRLTFVCPSSGNVQVRLRGTASGTTGATANWTFGVLDGATVRGRIRGAGGYWDTATSPVATSQWAHEGVFLVTGLTPGTSYTWDAAYGVDATQASGALKWGGPDDSTQDNAWGGFSYDIWNVDDLPRAIGSAA